MASVGPQRHRGEKGVNSKYNYIYMLITSISLVMIHRRYDGWLNSPYQGEINIKRLAKHSNSSTDHERR